MPTLPPWLTWVLLLALEGTTAAVHVEVFPYGSTGYRGMLVAIAVLGVALARGRPSDARDGGLP